MPVENSRISGLYKLSPEKRREKLQELTDLTNEEINTISKTGGVDIETIDSLSENVVGAVEYPFSIAPNFIINEEEYLIPISTEESSTVAALSYAGKMARPTGGYRAFAEDSIMFSQIQAVNVKNPFVAKQKILERKNELLETANEQDPKLVELGGGAQDIECRVIDSERGKMVITHLLVDCKDAMGGNTINTMAEAISPQIMDITGGDVYLRIISNLAKYRLARAYVEIEPDQLETSNRAGEEVLEGILYAGAFADADPHRAATHNKGIMNCVDSIAAVTMNDWRALEAGVHAFLATQERGYGPLTHWEKNEKGNLTGSIKIPLQIGVVGGATAVHPTAEIALKILGVESAKEFAEVIASAGLGQNLAALRVLASEGIQKGHMSLHAKNIAVQAGAPKEIVDEVAEKMLDYGKIHQQKAEEIIENLKKG